MLKSQTLIISSKAFSINRMYHKNRSFITAEYKDWAAGIFDIIDKKPNKKRIKTMRDFFNPTLHRYVFTMITYFPYEILITQKGTMSAKAFDVTNIEKPLQDILTMPKYFDQKPPFGAENLNMDDKTVSDFISQKRVSLTGECYIEFKIDIELLSDIIPDEVE